MITKLESKERDRKNEKNLCTRAMKRGQRSPHLLQSFCLFSILHAEREREREAVWPQNEERRKKCNYSFVYVHIAEKRRGERKTWSGEALHFPFLNVH